MLRLAPSALLVILALWLPARAAAQDPALSARLDRPRNGPGTSALMVLGGCLQDPDDPSCLDSAVHGADLVQRAAARALGQEGAERAEVVARYRRYAREGGRLRRDELLLAELEPCGPVLAHLDRGGTCDDTGEIPAPAPPRPPALAGLRRQVEQGLGARTARRVICGSVGRKELLEAVVVFAERKGGRPPAVTDLLCRRITLAEASRPETGPTGDEGHPAVIAASLAAACIEGEGLACHRDVAPLPGTLARDLLLQLGRTHEGSRTAVVDGARHRLSDLASRAEWAEAVVVARCGSLESVARRERCQVLPAADLPEPGLPDTLSPGEAARVRALMALVWRGIEPQPRQRHRVVCGRGAETREVVVDFTERPGQVPLVLDLRCR